MAQSYYGVVQKNSYNICLINPYTSDTNFEDIKYSKIYDNSQHLSTS